MLSSSHVYIPRYLPPLYHHRFIYYCLDKECTLEANPLPVRLLHALLFILWSDLTVHELHSCKVKLPGEMWSYPNVNEDPAHETLSRVKSPVTILGWAQGPELFYSIHLLQSDYSICICRHSKFSA